MKYVLIALVLFLVLKKTKLYGNVTPVKSGYGNAVPINSNLGGS